MLGTMTKDQEHKPGWDYYLEDVWWPRIRQPQRRRGSGEETENDFCRTVPAEYYSRHQMLRTEAPSYIMSPSFQNQKGAPVYAYRPGSTMPQAQKSWPSRAHDGSMEQKQASNQQDPNNNPDNDGFSR
ncbi:uncharacterized protein LOC129958608 [Argiope bruennichi]|uniref:uncharacterized protein LOC129958608 n=1 Tax=Argiope bruennichi TaxID=94029 RepID=UPI0024954C85|nr:uncharacterized protein LOC129958608 [Argiope bruennichi]